MTKEPTRNASNLLLGLNSGHELCVSVLNEHSIFFVESTILSKVMIGFDG